jgi:hypothetical protein
MEVCTRHLAFCSHNVDNFKGIQMHIKGYVQIAKPQLLI